MDTNELYARGLRKRKKMFGEADVEKRMAASGEFGAPLQTIINAYVYGDILPAAIETNRIAAEIFGEAPDPASGPAAKP